MSSYAVLITSFIFHYLFTNKHLVISILTPLYVNKNNNKIEQLTKLCFIKSILEKIFVSINLDSNPGNCCSNISVVVLQYFRRMTMIVSSVVTKFVCQPLI